MSEKNQKNFQKPDKFFDADLRAIESACEGLIFISETDAPVIPFCGDPAKFVGGETIIQQTGAEPPDPVEKVSFDDFFDRLTTVREWFGEAEKEKAKKFLDLKRLLEERLRDLKVFRVGRIRIYIYVVGVNKDGRLLGVRTKAVET